MTGRAVELHAENGTYLDLLLYCIFVSGNAGDWDGRIVPWESN